MDRLYPWRERNTSLKLNVFNDAKAFLAEAQTDLEEDEAANALMLGNALREAVAPEGGSQSGYFAVAADVEGLAAAAALSSGQGAALAGSRERPEAALGLIVDDMLARELAVSHVFGPARLAKRFAELWCARTGGRYELYFTQVLYQLTEVLPPRAAAGGMRPACLEDIPIVMDWSKGFDREIHGRVRGSDDELQRTTEERVRAGELYLWEDGEPVSMALHSRSTRRVAMVSKVYTLPARRGRGYGAATVAALSQQLLEQGYESTTLYTDAGNPATNRLYRKIGYRPIGMWERYVLKLDEGE